MEGQELHIYRTGFSGGVSLSCAGAARNALEIEVGRSVGQDLDAGYGGRGVERERDRLNRWSHRRPLYSVKKRGQNGAEVHVTGSDVCVLQFDLSAARVGDCFCHIDIAGAIHGNALRDSATLIGSVIEVGLYSGLRNL